MSKRDDLEQAFPATDAAGYISRGMSLRDYFAAHVLMVGGEAMYRVVGELTPAGLAQAAYQIADAMLLERQKL